MMIPIGPITVDTPLGPDALFFLSMSGREGLGQPFTYVIDLVSDDANIDLTSLLGQTMAVHLEQPPDEVRHFHGHITSADYVDTGRPGGAYRLIVRPWLWLLTNTTNCRIFQNKSTPDIVKQIFRDHGFGDFEESLSGNYAPAEYVVQYRETDFDFVSRLLERAGIYYYFEHTAAKHTLVLADSLSAHSSAPNCGVLPYYPRDAHRTVGSEQHVDRWHVTQNVTPGAVALRDFDFERPNANLAVRASAPKEHAAADQELYDYPGGYHLRSDGEDQARVRLEQRQESFEQVTGHTNARGLAVGGLFVLTGHPRDDQNGEYLVTSAHLGLVGHDPESGAVREVPPFSCEFTANDSSVPFRTMSRAAKPTVEGPQTAIVVGKAGEEIWTDKYGRVKVQFHWDRDGANDENSSCWVRVAQVWAGTNWGAMHIPRIGQEVIVDFLEGDPDQPIITGRVYNASNMPPYALPGNQTQSGIKSRSTKGGAIPNANEIRFEDRKGSEEFYIQAEKDLNSLVKNNETASVGVDRTRQVGQNDALSVGKNQTIKIGSNQTINVGADESLTVGGNETVSVTGNESDTVGGNQSVSVAGNDTMSVGGAQSLTVAAARSEVVGGAESIVVGGARSVAVGGAQSVTVGGDVTETTGGSVTVNIGGGRSASVGSDENISISGAQTITIGSKGAINVSKQLVIDAGDELVIKAGDASITLKKNGDIVLKGKNLTSDASGKVSVKAASDLVLKGSKISQN
jgi:type VI secretion system secreted protein VgrG